MCDAASRQHGEPYRLARPCLLKGSVVKGFGRGSKELGIPTANMDEHCVRAVDERLQNGIYYGFARVDSGQIYPMVMSIGWNPFYKNTKRSAEVHIIHHFGCDFYGQTLCTVIIGYIRSERDYESVDDLIGDIQCDIAYAKTALLASESSPYSQTQYFEQAF